MTKYICPDCKRRTMVKVVYTEERCDGIGCDHVNHNPHRFRRKSGGERK